MTRQKGKGGVFRGTRRQRGKQRGGGKKIKTAQKTAKKFAKQFVKEFKGTLNTAKGIYQIGKKKLKQKIKQKFQKGETISPHRYTVGGNVLPFSQKGGIISPHHYGLRGPFPSRKHWDNTILMY